MHTKYILISIHTIKGTSDILSNGRLITFKQYIKENHKHSNFHNKLKRTNAIKCVAYLKVAM